MCADQDGCHQCISGLVCPLVTPSGRPKWVVPRGMTVPWPQVIPDYVASEGRGDSSPLEPPEHRDHCRPNRIPSGLTGLRAEENISHTCVPYAQDMWGAVPGHLAFSNEPPAPSNCLAELAFPIPQSVPHQQAVS